MDLSIVFRILSANFYVMEKCYKTYKLNCKHDKSHCFEIVIIVSLLCKQKQ